jgi:hypothetical protein
MPSPPAPGGGASERYPRSNTVTTLDTAVPPPPPAVSRGRNYILWGCLALFVVGLLLIGSCAAFLLHGKRALDPYADRFFAAWDQEDYETVHEMASSTSATGLVDSVRRMRSQLGAVTERSFAGVNIEAAAQGKVAALTYRVRFERGSGMAILSLVAEADTWRIEGLSIDSDALDVAALCPRCGASNPAGANFCSECGQRLGAEVPEDAAAVEM